MACILNLTLGCWVENEDGDLGEFLRPHTNDFQSMDNIVASWNNRGYQKWPDIHYPCRPEHFELYDTLPDDWIRFKMNEGG